MKTVDEGLLELMYILDRRYVGPKAKELYASLNKLWREVKQGDEKEG